MKKLISFLLIAVMVLPLLPSLALWAGAEATELTVKPLYGVIENYSSSNGVAKTYFIVGTGGNAALYNGLKSGSYLLRVSLTDESTGETYVIPKYYFDDPSTEIYFDSSTQNRFLRLAVCEYGIVPYSSHSYTVTLHVTDSKGALCYSGSSAVGAFSGSTNRAFLADGAIIPDVIPHTHLKGDQGEYLPEEERFSDDMDGSGILDISDVSCLLNYLSGKTDAIQSVSDPDVNFDGIQNIGDVTEFLLLLSGKERLRMKLTGEGYTVVGLGNVSGTEITVPAFYNGKAVCAVKEGSFKGNTAISKVTLEGNTLIGAAAFADCTALTELYLPKVPGQVAENAFESSALQNVYYPGKKTEWLTRGIRFSCPVVVSVTELDGSGTVVDPFDSISLNGATAVTNTGGYSTVLRVKTTGELMFSPTLSELRALISRGASYDNYDIHLKFTDLTSNAVFPSVVAKGTAGRGDYVDIYLMGENNACGFCPTAGHNYKIDLIVTQSSSGSALFTGSYRLTAPENFRNSSYYRPTSPDNAGTVIPDNQFIKLAGSYVASYEPVKYGTVSGDTLQIRDAQNGFTAVTACPDPGYRFVIWSDGNTNATRNDPAGKDVLVTAHFALDSGGSEIPNMYIYTDTGAPILTKDYIHGTVVIRDAEKESYNIVATSRMKGRGNSSWNGSAPQGDYDSKNSYRLKFDEKLKLFGMGEKKNKDWVLNSNKFDLSGLRNWLVWDLANRMGTLPYVVESRWVQLYVNDEYRGMYTISEQVEAAGGRADVDDSLPGPDKGYLVEMDFRGDSDTDPYFYINGYDSSVEFVIKSDITTDADVAFIQEYIQRCHNAIFSGNRAEMEELMDVNSLIDMYILEELSKDVDAGRASFYLQKDSGGKLYFTAPWDFDFGFGTYGPGIQYTGLVSDGETGCFWFSSLIQRSWFRSAVLARMAELDNAFALTIEALSAKPEEIGKAADLNANFWNAYGRRYHMYVSGNVSGDLYSYQDHVDYLVYWTTARWETLKDLLKNY